MRLLLDTHVLLWAISEPKKLTPKIIELITDINNFIFVSCGSLWELQIKKALGKIILPEEFITSLEQCGYELLDITFEHIVRLGTLPPLHRDPFDRIIIAQSLAEDMFLITRDSDILKYDIKFIKF